MSDKKGLLSSLPKVDNIQNDERISAYDSIPKVVVLEAIRETLDFYRKGILSDKIDSISYDNIIGDIQKKIKNKSSMHLKRVINATGTVLHTNLGRAVLPKSAVEAVINASLGYNNLEFDWKME